MCLIADNLRPTIYGGERPRVSFGWRYAAVSRSLTGRLRYDVLLFIRRVIPSALIDLYHSADLHRVMDDLVAAPAPYVSLCLWNDLRTVEV